MCKHMTTFQVNARPLFLANKFKYNISHSRLSIVTIRHNTNSSKDINNSYSNLNSYQYVIPIININKKKNNLFFNSKNPSILNTYNNHLGLDGSSNLLLTELYDKNQIKLDNIISSNLDKNIQKNEIDNKSINVNNMFHEKEYKNIIYYPSSTKEWFNSIYSYNKTYIKPLVIFDLIVNRLFKSYLNLREFNLKKKIFKRRRASKFNYSSKRIHLSRAEIKHTNTTVTILLYIYNRPKYLRELYIRKLICSVKVKKMKNYFKGYKRLILKKNILWHILKKNFSIFNNFNIVVFTMNNIFQNKLSQIIKHKFFEKFKSRRLSIILGNKYLNKLLHFNFYKLYKNIVLRKLFRRERIILNNIRRINLNKSIFNNILLNLKNLGISNILSKLYCKNVVIKIVDLKSIHLSSDLLSSVVAIKLRNRNNRAINILRRVVSSMVKIPTFHTLVVNDDYMETFDKKNVLDFIEQQVVSGVRFQASGRLTKRLTAMRAVVKRRYVGSLRNIRSSYNRKPSTILRGYIKSNLQYNIVQSKTRNGSFGLKGWLSSH